MPASVPPAGPTAELLGYDVIRELGRGGMGVVYLARNRMLDRLEVLKVLSAGLMDRAGARERFLAEARAAARLDHPNVVKVFSVAPVKGTLALAMEYVDGADLSRLVKGRLERDLGPLPVLVACHYGRQAALGLQHAHERGMVHRDVKPHNLMLAVAGKRHTVKVLDFGLAKAVCGPEADSGLTGTGQMLGTPDYVAPEQTLDAAGVDIRADVYSLGCTLYYLLAGRPPFTGRSAFEVLQAHHSQTARPLDAVRDDVPAALAAVVATMMAKNPADRYPTPGDAAAALEPFVRRSASSTKQSKNGFSDTISPVDETPPEPVPGSTRPETQPAPPAEELLAFEAPAPPKRTRPAPNAIRVPLWVWIVAVNAVSVTALLLVFLLWPRPVPRVASAEPTRSATNPPTDAPPKEPTPSTSTPDDSPPPPPKEKPLAPFPIQAAPAPVFEVAKPNPPPAQADAPFVPWVDDQDFVHLFNGRDLAGWEVHPPDGRKWEVVDGVLVGGAGSANKLFSHRSDYRNFVFRVEAMINDKGIGGQQFRSAADSIDNKAYEAVITSNYSFARRTGSLESFFNPQLSKTEREKLAVRIELHKPDEWFTQEVTADGNHIVVKVNGATTVDFIDEKNTYSVGHLVLNKRGPKSVLKFRRIAVKEIRPTETTSEDEMSVQVKRVSEEYEKSMKASAARLSKEFDRQISVWTTRTDKPTEKRTAMVEQLKAEKETFESRGLLPWSQPMRLANLEYLTALTANRKKLEGVYLKAVNFHLKNNADAKAQEWRSKKDAALAPTVLSVWSYSAGSIPVRTFKLYSDGSVNRSEYEWNFVKVKDQFVLIFRFPQGNAGGKGFNGFIDTLSFEADDGKKISGTNQFKNMKISATIQE